MHDIVTYATSTYLYLPKISSIVHIFKFWIPIIWTLHLHEQDVRIHNYFSKPKGVYGQQHFLKTDLYEFFVTIFIHKVDTNITYPIFWQQPKIKQTINKLHQL
jgi:hypothetical protein